MVLLDMASNQSRCTMLLVVFMSLSSPIHAYLARGSPCSIIRSPSVSSCQKGNLCSWRMSHNHGQLTLSTFPVSQLITPARLSLFIAGVDFRENIMSLASAGNMSVPCLTLEDGTEVTRGIPILNYCAKISGMYPADARHQLWCDALIDSIEEQSKVFRPIWFEQDNDKRITMRRALVQDGSVTRMLATMDSMVSRERNFIGSGEDHITIAHLYIYNFAQTLLSLDGFPDDVLQGFDNVKEVHTRLGRDSKVMQWVKSSHAPWIYKDTRPASS